MNAIPVFIASDPVWAKRFTDAGVPIIGDDIKSQVGATIVHRVLARLFEDRGTVLDRTYQLNVGGNMDFKNMLERERLESKKISKTQAVTSQIDRGIAAESVHIGPSDHVAWLEDRKWAYIRLEGRNFGDVPLNIELKLEVWDSPNSAGVIIDALRCARIALDRGIGGPLVGPVGLLHEVAAGAVPRRGRPPDGRGVRRTTPSGRPGGPAAPGLADLVGPPADGAARPTSSSPSRPSSRRISRRNARARPTSRPGAMPRMRHHLAAVELRADRVERLPLPQLREADLELVHPPLERPGLAPGCGSCSPPG